jgi:glutamate-1-semialdehyde 2,1-aminomutase
VNNKSRRRSEEIFSRSRQVLVGGVNSPVRAFGAVGGSPVVAERASGAQLWDADGNAYLDYVCSWGALILGHADPVIAAAIAEQARRGTSYGMTTELEVELAELLRARLPALERVRFVSSGTEATMSAVRVARGATGRDLVVKFAGCYHGHSDGFLSQAGSGLATFGIAASPGVPQVTAALTLDAPYNDLAAVEKIFGMHRDAIAAVIVEPVAANMGVVPPAPGFLQGLREITRRDGALLIFDEVITGFRLHNGGAQTLFGVQPDLMALGKVIGGGLPAAVYGGSKDLMEKVAPAGAIYQAGTLSGNPLAMRAGIETMKRLAAPGLYEGLEAKGAELERGLRSALAESGTAAQVQRAGSLLTLFFAEAPVTDYASAKHSNTTRFGKFFRAMLERGVLLPPSQFEALFISTAHTEDDIRCTVAACRESLGGLS